MMARFSLCGDSERTLAKWFKRTGKRDEIFLSTKFGYKIPEDNDWRKLIIDSSAKYCKEACEKSLKTLGIDCIDICALSFEFSNAFQLFFRFARVCMAASLILSLEKKFLTVSARF